MSKITEKIGRIRGVATERRPSRRQVFALALALVLTIWTPAMLAGVGSVGVVEPGYDGVAAAQTADGVEANGTVIFASSDGNYYGVDASSGSQEWSVAAHDNRGGATVYDGVVYLTGAPNNEIQARYASNGTLIGSYSATDTVHSHPTIVDGTVYAGTRDGKVLALEPETLNETWTYDTGTGRLESTPFVENGMLYVGSTDNHVYAIDTSTQTEEWSYNTGVAITSSPLLLNDTVYIGDAGNSMHALDADTGSSEWYFNASGVKSSPVIVGDSVYFGSRAGVAYSVDKDTGAEEWSHSVSNDIEGSVTVANDTVVFGDNDGNVTALDHSTGNFKWEFNPDSQAVDKSPTVVGETVYVAHSDGATFALDLNTGAEEWNFNTGTQIITTAPTVVEDDSTKSSGSRVLYGTLGHHDELLKGAQYGSSTSDSDSSQDTSTSKQSVGLVEDDLEMFPPSDTELVVTRRTSDYYPLWEVAGYSVEEWREEAWVQEETATFNWANKTTVALEDGEYYRLELHSLYGTWEDSGFQYDKAEYSGSTIWLEPDTGHLDDNGDGTAGGSSSEGTNGPGSGDSDDGSDDGSGDEDQGFGPTALGTCSTLDGQDGVEVEYWDPGYETWELEANLSADGSKTYHIYKEFSNARGYYRGCLGDSVTDNSSDDRGDLSWNHTARNETGAIVSSGGLSYDPPVFGPTGNAPDSTGERVGLLAGVLGALGVLWFGGQRYVPASSVSAWPSESISPAFGIGAPIVAVLGLDLAGGGVISASVATGLAQIAPFAGIVGVTVGGYAVLRWIRAPPS